MHLILPILINRELLFEFLVIPSEVSAISAYKPENLHSKFKVEDGHEHAHHVQVSKHHNDEHKVGKHG